MQKCPICKFKKVAVETIRNEKGYVIETQSVCQNCGHVKQKKKIRLKFWEK